jgi:hypothetical protein
VSGSGPIPRRAPRLAPDQRIARHITRAGRFRRIDPTRTRRPDPWRLAGALLWAGLLAEALRRARRRVRYEADTAE